MTSFLHGCLLACSTHYVYVKEDGAEKGSSAGAQGEGVLCWGGFLTGLPLPPCPPGEEEGEAAVHMQKT